MNIKENVIAALNHKPCKKIPVDFGATAVTGIHATCVEKLREYFGLEKQPVKVFEPYQMLGWVDEDLADAMGVDIRGVFGRTTLFGFPNENWREYKMPWGQVVLVSEHFKTTQNEKGDIFIYPAGDTSAEPSGHMPAGGYFFDTIIRQEPIDDTKLNPEDNLEEFQPISEQDLKYYRDIASKIKDEKHAIIASFGGTGLGDIALVPAPFMKKPKGIRDVAEWYISTITRKDYIHAIFTKQVEIALKNLEKIKNIFGSTVNVIFVCGTDFGTQTSTFCSPQTFDELYAPYYKKINSWIHKNTTWKTFKHSCGAVESLMSRFIDVGFDIINPVQCSASGMDPQNLKKKYGEKIVFWGGGVDTQKTLPFGTPEQVKKEVQQRCRIFAENGGFVFNTVHNIQAQTPVENVIAMLDALKNI